MVASDEAVLPGRQGRPEPAPDPGARRLGRVLGWTGYAAGHSAEFRTVSRAGRTGGVGRQRIHRPSMMADVRYW